MGEGFRNLTFLVWALCAVNTNAHAVEKDTFIAEESASEVPTIVYGSAKKSEGGSEEVLVEQPENAPNPLGNPLVVPNPTNGETSSLSKPAEEVSSVRKSSVSDSEADNTALGKDFQNTLMEANGMVYDVQAYPEKDLKAIGNSSDPETIYSPNVNP